MASDIEKEELDALGVLLRGAYSTRVSLKVLLSELDTKIGKWEARRTQLMEKRGVVEELHRPSRLCGGYVDTENACIRPEGHGGSCV